MPTAVPATFLNLDLELESDSDLSRLAEHFANSDYVLYNGPCPSGYRLTVEPLINGALSPESQACTTHFLAAVRSLPTNLDADWAGCFLRVFDYGVDGGLESPPLTLTISPEELQQMASLGIGVRVTVYPHREPTEEEI